MIYRTSIAHTRKPTSCIGADIRDFSINTKKLHRRETAS